MSEIVPERLVALREAKGWSQSELGRRSGIGQSTVNRLEGGLTRNPRAVHAIAAALGTSAEYLLGLTDDEDGSGQVSAPAPSDDRILEIPVLDMEYGMGATYLENVDPEVRLEPFPLSFIRRFSKARADQLFIAEGLGDSMSPTIGTNDLLLIDRSADTLRVADQIWAFSFGGAGMVKRLRPRPDGSIAILSDNPSVAEDKAVDDELFLIGRVVAIVRKV